MTPAFEASASGVPRDRRTAVRAADHIPGLCVDVEPQRDVVVVRPRGELDLATAPAVDRQLQELFDAGFRRLALDLSGLSFIDSSGLHLALDWATTASREGLEMRFLPGSPAIQRPFEITGVVEMLTWIEHIDSWSTVSADH